MRRKAAWMIQSFYSMCITVYCILKALNMALLLYLSLNSPLKMTISMYHTICKSNKYMDNWSKSKLVQRQQPRTLHVKNILGLIWGAKKDSLGSPTTIYHPKTNWSLIEYLSNGNYDQNMRYWYSCNIYLYITYHSSVYDITYKTLGHTHQ